MKFNLLIAGILCSAGIAMGQSYRFEATLADSVANDGFYNIRIEPKIEAKLLYNYADVRILDKENNQVPYIQKSESPYFKENRFIEYPVVSKKISENCCTQLVIKNLGKKAINNICLILKNSNAVKLSRISGSDDGVNWFGVGQYDLFYNQNSESDTTVINYIHFPVTNYLYYQLEITDRGYWNAVRWVYWNENRWDYPVNILKVGHYESFLREGKYTALPKISLTQNDSTASKQSYIKLSFDDTYSINRIRFNIEGPRYYKRRAVLALRLYNKATKKFYYDAIAYLELNSYSLNEFNFSSLREKELYLIIDNDDNRPLRFISTEAWQLNRYLKAYLEKGKQYRLVYGDSLGRKPEYDLAYFTDSIPQILPTLPITTISENEIIVKKEVKMVRWFENKLFIWLAIGAVFVLLGFMSWKMLKEMGRG